MAHKTVVKRDSSITDIVFNPIVGNFMTFSTKDPNTSSTPTKFQSYCARIYYFLLLLILFHLQYLTSWLVRHRISTNTRIADNRILSPLGKLSVNRLFANGHFLLLDHLCTSYHFSNIIANPHADFKMFVNIVNMRILPWRSRNGLVLSISPLKRERGWKKDGHHSVNMVVLVKESQIHRHQLGHCKMRLGMPDTSP